MTPDQRIQHTMQPYFQHAVTESIAANGNLYCASLALSASRIDLWMNGTCVQERRFDTPRDAYAGLRSLVRLLTRHPERAYGGVAPITVITRKEAKTESQPRLFDQRGTGTDGPAPALQPAAISRPAIATKRITYGQLLTHIVRTVKGTLEAEKLQLGDDPTQKIIVTLYIDACKQLRPEYDVRGAE